MLAPEFAEACSKDKFMQADASRPDIVEKILKTAEGKTYDYVFNCGGETRYSQEDAVYRSRSYLLSLTLGKAVAAAGGCKAFVEVSTGFVYAPDKVPRRENDRCKPWLKLAKWKLEAEEALAKLQKDGGDEVNAGLPLVVMRTAHIYGPYTGRWLGTALALARVYQQLGKEMKFLWSRELKTNCVHVEDVARALWAAAAWRAALPASTKLSPFSAGSDDPATTFPVFNVVDHGATAQSTLADLVNVVFQIPTTFTNAFINTFARLNLEHVVDDVNDETLDPWSDMLRKSGCVENTPLTPFMEKELLQDKDMNLDGARFERVAGFKYGFCFPEGTCSADCCFTGINMSAYRKKRSKM